MSERPTGNANAAVDVPALRWPVAAGIVSALLVVVLGGSWLLTRATLGTPAAALPTRAEVTLTAVATAAAGTLRSLPETTTTDTGSVTRGTLTAASARTGAVGTGAGTTGTPNTGAITGPVSAGVLGGVTPVAAATVPPTATPRGWWDASSDVPDDERAQVEQAYAHFWDVRGQALLELDPDLLTEIMAGTELTAEQQAIQDLRSSGRAQHVSVEHHERVAWATADAATILDEYVSHTVLVDAETKAPLEDPPSAPFRLAYLFRKVDGRWLAVDAVRVVYAQ